MFYNGQLEMNSNKKQGFRIIAEHIEQILIQNTSTLPEKGTFRNERPKTADNAIVESQTKARRRHLQGHHALTSKRSTPVETFNTKVCGDLRELYTSGPGCNSVGNHITLTI